MIAKIMFTIGVVIAVCELTGIFDILRKRQSTGERKNAHRLNAQTQTTASRYVPPVRQETTGPMFVPDATELQRGRERYGRPVSEKETARTGPLFVPPTPPEPERPLKSSGGEIVYILTNRSMPGIVKIGRTTGSASQRASNLRTTGVPTAFEVYYAAFVDDAVSVEASMHRQFASHRVDGGREFFKVEPRLVHKALAKHATGDATFS
jgi:Meiotically up-regulated gene 113